MPSPQGITPPGTRPPLTDSAAAQCSSPFSKPRVPAALKEQGVFPKKLFGGGEPGKSLSHTNFLYAFKDNAKWDQPLAGAGGGARGTGKARTAACLPFSTTARFDLNYPKLGLRNHRTRGPAASPGLTGVISAGHGHRDLPRTPCITSPPAPPGAPPHLAPAICPSPQP